jgi:hypothetical protein
MQRLFRARTVENVMWAIPGWSGPPNWTQQGIRVGCINGETTECVRILHVGSNGSVAGPAAAAFPNCSVAGLLDAWLNDDFVRASTVDAGQPLHLKTPAFRDGRIVMFWSTLAPAASHHFPITYDNNDKRAAAQWPPDPSMPSTVSPENESAHPVWAHTHDRLTLRLKWLHPFDGLQPMLISPDDILARDHMRVVEEKSSKSRVAALVEAKVEAREWISDNQASLFEAWLMPIIASEGEEGALFAIEARYGVQASSLSKAYEHIELQKHLDAQVPVTRAWGIPGLMWALLLDRLSSEQPFRYCERCGRRLSGKKHKRYCSVSDDPSCFQARKAEDRRRSRGRNTTPAR